MSEFRIHQGKITWSGNNETLQLEAWGKDSLRVRARYGHEIRQDLVNALLDPPPSEAQIDLVDERAILRNGAITAEVLPGGDRFDAGKQAVIRILDRRVGLRKPGAPLPHYARSRAGHRQHDQGLAGRLVPRARHPDPRAFREGVRPGGSPQSTRRNGGRLPRADPRHRRDSRKHPRPLTPTGGLTPSASARPALRRRGPWRKPWASAPAPPPWGRSGRSSG